MLSRFRLKFSCSWRKTVSALAAFTILILLFNLPAFAAAGDLDASFGQNGISPAPGLNPDGASTCIALQPDGKIIVGGIVRSPPGFYSFTLVRYLPDGSVDTSFGNGGNVITPPFVSNSSDSNLNDVAVLADGKIIAVGWVRVPDTVTPFARQSLIVFRYNANGSLDTTFHDNGKFIYGEGGFIASAEAVKVQPDDKFVVAGYTGSAIKGNVPYKSLLFRFAGNTLDAAFNNGQTQVVPGDTLGYSVALQADGKIIVGGRTNSSTGNGLSLTRYNADATIDTSFGNNGRIIRANENLSEAIEVLAQPDGKIVAVSSIFANSNLRDFAILRFNSDGSPDSSFGTGGKVITAVSNRSDTPSGGVLQANGKIVVSGASHYYAASTPDIFPILVRYNADGSLDRTFGIGGIARTPSPASHGDIILQPDGKILTSISLRQSSVNSSFRTARYLANGTRDFDFDGDRNADVSIFRPNSAAEWYWLGSSNNESSGLQFGVDSDKPAAADFDGDGKTDVAVFRDGDWYRINSSDNQFVAVHFGQAGDKPVAADYDGDGGADLAVYRQGNWYILNSADDSFRAEQFGIASDKPVLGDFDADGKNDLAVYRDGTWYLLRSREGFFGVQFGIASDKPVTADYDGDGKTDLAVYRPADGTWYLLRSNLGFTATQFGISSDKPVPADYDNDGKADIAVYREGIWYLLQSSAGFRGVQFGAANDFPVPAAFLP
ncbi:MAG TPA: FG-GAP-like repeat-containing protein [Pyrinomonadaceae bacterium]|jgi:uncharacterized delta-60 repeat protein